GLDTQSDTRPDVPTITERSRIARAAAVEGANGCTFSHVCVYEESAFLSIRGFCRRRMHEDRQSYTADRERNESFEHWLRSRGNGDSRSCDLDEYDATYRIPPE